jgi:DNA-binding ferritin-like protein
MSAEHIHFLLTLRNQLKLYHWQTKSYARHKAVDKILEELDTHIDSFVEIYIGKYGRPKLSATQGTLKIRNLTDAGATSLCKSAAIYLQKQLVKGLTAADSDLINIRDEMLGEMHQLLYLFTLK